MSVIQGEDESMEHSDIKVSICCLTYNHEKYIRQALDSFLMQKTNFEYEILIHDDASTDKTAEIIHEYEEKYPNIIKPIYQTENQYSQGVKVSWKYQYPRAKGKYIAMCEGDDFWCDENKLQLQYDTLENNIAVFCAHKVRLVTESGERLDKTIPNDTVGYQQSGEEFLFGLLEKFNYPFQTSSYMFKREVIDKECNEVPDFIKIAPVGDVFLMMLLATKGEICYLAQEMSCYRQFSVSSWSSSIVGNKGKRIIHEERVCAALEAFDKYTNFYFHEYVCEGLRRRTFIVLGLKEQHYDMLLPLYRDLFKQFPISIQIYIFCSARIPRLISFYRKLKSKLLK